MHAYIHTYIHTCIQPFSYVTYSKHSGLWWWCIKATFPTPRESPQTQRSKSCGTAGKSWSSGLSVLKCFPRYIFNHVLFYHIFENLVGKYAKTPNSQTARNPDYTVYYLIAFCSQARSGAQNHARGLRRATTYFPPLHHRTLAILGVSWKLSLLDFHVFVSLRNFQQSFSGIWLVKFSGVSLKFH